MKEAQSPRAAGIQTTRGWTHKIGLLHWMGPPRRPFRHTRTSMKSVKSSGAAPCADDDAPSVDSSSGTASGRDSMARSTETLCADDGRSDAASEGIGNHLAFCSMLRRLKPSISWRFPRRSLQTGCVLQQPSCTLGVA